MMCTNAYRPVGVTFDYFHQLIIFSMGVVQIRIIFWWPEIIVLTGSDEDDL